LTPLRFVEKNIRALRRRHDYLQGIKRNSYDNAELSALNWALHILHGAEVTSQEQIEHPSTGNQAICSDEGKSVITDPALIEATFEEDQRSEDEKT